ncbi:MAG: hypothetical protein ACYDCQ_10105, partial [Dehalococcoidia bacterium]
MKLSSNAVLLAVTVALAAAPATAAAAGRGEHPGPANAPTHEHVTPQSTVPSGPPATIPAGAPATTPAPGTPAADQGNEETHPSEAPSAGPPLSAKAFGRYCKSESKKHLAGTPG